MLFVSFLKKYQEGSIHDNVKNSVLLSNLKATPWKQIVNEAPEKTCLRYSLIFNAEARKIGLDSPVGQGCALLGVLCSLTFTLDEKEAFNPCSYVPTGDIPSPNELSASQIEELFQFLCEIDDPELKARLADVIWLNQGEHKLEAAKIALEEYKKTIENLKDGHQFDVIDRLCRLANLVYELGKGMKEQQEEILNYLASYVMELPVAQSCGYAHRIFVILLKRKEKNFCKLIERCRKIAEYHKATNSFHKMRRYLELQHDMMKKSKADANDLRKIKANIAESHVLEGEIAGSALAKSVHLNEAIKAYRNFGGFQERIDELHALLIQEEQHIKDEMIEIHLPPIDISAFIKQAKENVSGHSFLESLKILSNIQELPSESDLRQKALESIYRHPFLYLGQENLINEKGKLMGIVPPTDFNRPRHDNKNSKAVEIESIKDLIWISGLIAQAILSPAINQISEEHVEILEELTRLVTGHPFVPPGHEKFFAHGLYAGFEKDFALALHFLVPQIENSIRHILEKRGDVKTSTLSSTGIQKERDLNALVQDENVIKIFGADFIFILRGLFTDGHGYNLRNRLAHGLLNHDDLQSQQCVFCWWLILRLIMKPELYGERDTSSEKDSA